MARPISSVARSGTRRAGSGAAAAGAAASRQVTTNVGRVIVATPITARSPPIDLEGVAADRCFSTGFVHAGELECVVLRFEQVCRNSERHEAGAVCLAEDGRAAPEALIGDRVVEARPILGEIVRFESQLEADLAAIDRNADRWRLPDRSGLREEHNRRRRANG